MNALCVHVYMSVLCVCVNVLCVCVCVSVEVCLSFSRSLQGDTKSADWSSVC